MSLQITNNPILPITTKVNWNLDIIEIPLLIIGKNILIPK